MAALGEHSNVYSTALDLLRLKGFTVWYEEGSSSFWCQREGWDFCSDSPCGLLGLVAIFEHKNPSKYTEY